MAQQPACASWNQACSEGHLAKIAKSISDWRAVSPFLGLTEADEIAILGSHPHSVAAQKIAMLRKWKQKHGAKRATYKRLCRVFDDCERVDLVDKVKQLLAESNSSSDEEDTTVSISVPVVVNTQKHCYNADPCLSHHGVVGIIPRQGRLLYFCTHFV